MCKAQPGKPVVYACSGASNLAQLANDVALWLHNEGKASMVSIATIGAGWQKDIEDARAATGVIAIDGCERQCTKTCLSQRDIETNWHFKLSALGFDFAESGTCSLGDTFAAMQHVSKQLGEPMASFSAHLKAPERR